MSAADLPHKSVAGSPQKKSADPARPASRRIDRPWGVGEGEGDNARYVAESLASITRPAVRHEMCIVTQGTREMAHYTTITGANHLAYASEHGALYRAFDGRISGERFWHLGVEDRVRREGLFWQDIAVVEAMLGLTTENGAEAACGHVLWVDGDVLFTDFTKSVQERLAEFGVGDPNRGLTDHDVALSLEEWEAAWAVPSLVQGGVFLVKNSPGGRAFIREIGGMFEDYKNEPLGDQTAMGDWAIRGNFKSAGPGDPNAALAGRRANVALLPQRAMDSFHGYGATGEEAFDERFLWRRGDFAAHFTGDKSPTGQAERLVAMRELAAAAFAGRLRRAP